MGKNDNIFVKLQIERDRDSGELALNIHFDTNTPNFFSHKNVLSWYPTVEELAFVNEAFKMISNYTREKKNKGNIKFGTGVEKKIEKHSKTFNEEVASKASKEREDTEDDSSLSESEKKEVNEWFV